ncbi:MAG: hypothetical protein IPN90_07395 [Elusimicrobia bacterium]|nr:hypothetical protein [Elusimicrobiota bacterium]
MRRSRPVLLPAVVAAGLGLFGILSVSAWFHVQSVRLSYRCQAVRQEMDLWDHRAQAELRSLEAALSLSRLDASARGRRGLALPRPDQIRLLVDI